MNSIEHDKRLAAMDIPQLIDVIRETADELELRLMQNAGVFEQEETEERNEQNSNEDYQGGTADPGISQPDPVCNGIITD